MKNILKFKNLELARSYSYRAVKALWIIDGNDGTYWIVTPAVANKLINDGYKLIF